MDFTATCAVLTAALLHAGWNAALKRQGDPLLGALGVSLGTLATCLLVAPWLPRPDSACWPGMAVSIGVHLGYFTALSLAYRGGHLAPLYALMRGTPPLLVAAVGALWLGERLVWTGYLGIGILCAGLLLLVQGRPANGKTLALALTSAACTATYTLLDGHNSRLAGNAIAYTVWHGALQSALFALGVLAVRGRSCLPQLRASAGQNLLAGAASIAAYGAVLWAMGRAPVALVAALRESSVIFAALLGAVWLKEPLGTRRLAAAVLVAVGAAVMHG